jgi:acyl-coenzyme A thioesterase PaaI-like protein
MPFSQRLSVFLWNLYPPFLGAGIKITAVSPDWRWLEARLKFRWWNRNYVGTMFGGSLFSLCDPFHMVLLINRLGKGYVVRDKGGEIKYLRKGTSDVKVRFELDERQVENILRDPAEIQEQRFLSKVKDGEGNVIAEVVKVLHIRRIGR